MTYYNKGGVSGEFLCSGQILLSIFNFYRGHTLHEIEPIGLDNMGIRAAHEEKIESVDHWPNQRTIWKHIYWYDTLRVNCYI